MDQVLGEGQEPASSPKLTLRNQISAIEPDSSNGKSSLCQYNSVMLRSLYSGYQVGRSHIPNPGPAMKLGFIIVFALLKVSELIF